MTAAPLLLIGTYTTDRASLGTYLCSIDARNQLRVRGVCAAADPSFVVRHPHLPLAYAVNELPEGYGSVSVLTIDAVHHRVEVQQQVTSGGEAPCHVAVAADGSGLFVAHYGCGTVRWLGLDILGRLTGETHAVQHEGSSVRPRRQASAHPHCVVLCSSAARGNGVYVTDLGQDCIVHYGFEPASGLIERSRSALHAGAGPRHLCFAQDDPVAFVGNELDNTVSTLAVDAGGHLTELHWRSTLPENCPQRSAIGEIALHPSGRWLYVSNRGIDTISWFTVAGGELTWGGMVPSQGQHPRHFLVTPDGRHLIVANRDADNLVLFSIDQHSGAPLAPGVISTEVPAPVCVCWL